MNFSNFFIRRPIFAGVLSTLIFLVGLLAVFRLPISEYPEVVPPTVVVQAQYPGANPKTIAETVASPLEQSINGVEDSLYMAFRRPRSDGVMTSFTITFKLGTDIDKAQVCRSRTAFHRRSPNCQRKCAISASQRPSNRQTSPWLCTFSRPTISMTRSICAITRPCR